MKIIFWTASFLPELGGMQWSIYRLAKALEKRGHQILFLTKLPERGNLELNVSVIRLPGDSILEWTNNSVCWLLENQNQYDVVQVIDFFYQAVDEQFDFLRKIKKPTALKIPTAGYVSKLMNSKQRVFALKSVKGIIALNDIVSKELIDKGVLPDKIYRIANGINPEEFVPSLNKDKAKIDLGLPLDKVLIIFSGRFVARKRLDVLLSALEKTDDNIHLILVGSSFSQRDSVDEQLGAALKRLSEKITVIEPVNDCLPYLQASDIQILLSEREGMPNALLEGMSCALPTIATNIPGIIDLISNQVEGILVPVGDVEEVAKAINLLACNYDLRCNFGNLARKKIIAKFNIGYIAEQYELLYKKITNKKGELNHESNISNSL